MNIFSTTPKMLEVKYLGFHCKIFAKKPTLFLLFFISVQLYKRLVENYCLVFSEVGKREYQLQN